MYEKGKTVKQPLHLEKALHIQLEAGVDFVVKRAGKNACCSSLEKGALKIDISMGHRNKCLFM